MRTILLILFILFSATLFSKISSAQDQPEIFTDKIFKPTIHTIQLYVEPLVLTDPVIGLNGPSQLHLAFDDLDGGKKAYYMTVIQCNYDWSPSELINFDYISGFNAQEIRDYQFSFNTNQTFTHYSLLFPNDDFHITKSGNYILKVYEDDNPDDVIFTRRFIVVNNMVEITSEVKQ